MAGKPLEPNSPLTVYNTQTMQPERLRSGEVEQAILSGSHDFQAGATINIIGPDGKTGGGGVPAEELRKYLEAGYRLETPFEKVVNDYSDENDNVTGALKVGAQKAISEFALGIPETIADYAQNPLDLAKRKRLYEDHQAAAVVGSLVGGGAGLVYGAPVFKAAEVAGKVVGRTLQKGIAETLIKSGVSAGVAKRVAVGMAGKIPSAAAQFAVEGAAVTAPRALTEAAFGDLDAAAESMLMGVGVGSVLGAAGSAVSPIAKGIGLSYRKFVKRPIARFGEEEAPVVGRAFGETAEDAAAPRAAVEFPSDTPSGVLTAEEITARGKSYNRANADELDKDIQYLIGQDATPGIKSNLRSIQDQEGKMAMRDTEAGIALRQKHQDIGNAVEGDVSKTFGVNEQRNAQVMAKEASEGLNTRLQEIVAPSEASFRQLDEALAPVTLVDKEMGSIFEQTKARILRKAEELQIDVDDPMIEAALKAANVTRTPNLDARSVLSRSQKLGRDAADSSRAAMFGTAGAYDRAALLREGQDSLIEGISGVLEKRGAELGGTAVGEAGSVLQQFRDAKAQYAQFKTLREPVAKLLGISNKTGSKGFEEALSKIDPEDLIPRLMKATEKQIAAVREISPEIADMILRAKQGAFANRAQIGTRDGISVARISAAYKKAIADGKGYMFSPEQRASMERAMRIQEAMPQKLKNFNPSGTAAALESNTALGKLAADIPFFGKMVAGLIDEGSDNFTSKLAEKITSTSAIPATQSLMRNTTKILRKVDAAVESALKGAAPRVERIRVRTGSVLERVLNQGDSASQKNAAQMTPQERMQEYVRRSESFASNIEASQEKLDDAFGGFYHYGAPETAGIAMNKATMAVNYLQSQIPPMSKPSSPYDKTPPRVSDSAIAAFERRLEVTEDPGIVAERLADGTLSKEHVETLRAIYPSIYGYMQQVTSERMAEVGMKKMSYQQRLKISLLMGLEVHPSMTGQTIATMQNTFAPKDPGQMPQGMGSGSSASSSDSLASRTQTAGQKGQMA